MQNQEKTKNKLKKVLIVGDIIASFGGIIGTLAYSGMECMTACSGIDAIKVLLESRNDFGCIILDDNIGDIGGIEVARIIRTRFGHLPIVLLTSENDVSAEIEARSVGISCVLREPVTESELSEAVILAMG